MNPFAGLLGEPMPPLTAELPRHVHCLADEIDPDTGLTSNAKGPRPPKHLVRAAAAPAPRLLTPDPTPGPKAYRVPAPVPRAPMTYPEAMLIRDRARRRQPVTAAELLEANKVVQATRARSREQGE